MPYFGYIYAHTYRYILPQLIYKHKEWLNYKQIA